MNYTIKKRLETFIGNLFFFFFLATSKTNYQIKFTLNLFNSYQSLFESWIKHVIWGNIHLGKCDSGNCLSGKCPFKEFSFRVPVLQGIVHQGKVLWGKVGQGNVHLGTVQIPGLLTLSWIMLKNSKTLAWKA